MTKSEIYKKLLGGFKTAMVYGLILVVASFLGNLWMSRDQVSGKAPLIQALNLQGQAVNIDLASYDGPVLLYFFAEWCPICKVQHSVISSINEDYPVIAIAMQSGGIDDVRAYVEQQGLDFYVLNDRVGNVSQRFGVHGVPASFIVDQQGVIRFSTRGYATQLGLLSRLWLTQSGIL